MIDYNAISFKFFGCSLDEVREVAIITNIHPIYLSLTQSGNALVESKGFYSYATVQTDQGLVFSLFGITPGNCIIDVVKIIAQKSKSVFFCGIGGALSDGLEIGDVVEVSNFCSVDHIGNILKKHSTGFGRTITQTDGLVQNNEYYRFLREQTIDIVDMESVDFLDICQRLSLNFHYFIHISDIPLKNPFYNAKTVPINANEFLRQVEKYVN